MAEEKFPALAQFTGACIEEKNDCEHVSAETLIVGFPGHGIVGSIAGKHLISQLELDVIGFIRSPLIPPVAVFLEGVLTYPYRIYGSPDAKIAVLLGEAPTPANAYYHLANTSLDWAEKVEANQVICLDGFPIETREKDPTVYLVSEPEDQILGEKSILSLDLPRPQTGFIAGLSGAILNEAVLRESIDGYALLVDTLSHLPDPEGAAHLCKLLKGWKDLDIKIKPLLSDAEHISRAMSELAEKTHQMQVEEVPLAQKQFYI